MTQGASSFTFRGSRRTLFLPVSRGSRSDAQLTCLVWRSLTLQMEAMMKYILSWTTPPSVFRAAVERFLETGAAPPKGVELLGRWHGMSGTGFAIARSDDAKAMYQYQAQWADLLELSVTPCVEDDEAGAVLAQLSNR